VVQTFAVGALWQAWQGLHFNVFIIIALPWVIYVHIYMYTHQWTLSSWSARTYTDWAASSVATWQCTYTPPLGYTTLCVSCSYPNELIAFLTRRIQSSVPSTWGRAL